MNFHYKNIKLEVPDSVYFPSEDSIFLAEVIEKEQLENKECLDMGCGSGFLSILMAKKNAGVISVDISKNAIKSTEKNAEKNKVKIKVLKSDLFSKIKESYNIIIFNPPYLLVEHSKKESKQWAAGKRAEIIKKFIEQSKNYLKDNGKILLLISSLTNEKDILKAFQINRFLTKIAARKKIFFEELIVVEACLKGEPRIMNIT